MNVAFFLFALRAVDALTLKQAPGSAAPVALPAPEAAPVALPASETARSNSDEAAAIAAGYEAQTAIANTVAATFRNNNATVAGVQAFATETVAATKASLNATAEQALAEARGGAPALAEGSGGSGFRVLLGAKRAGAGVAAGLNATHVKDIKNATMTYYFGLLSNVTANLTNMSKNLTEYMYSVTNASWDRTWFANGTAKNSSGVANWTEIAVATAVDPHWGPLAVNATNQSLREVDRTRHFADAVDFKVQHAQMDASEAMKSAKAAVLAAAAAQASADDALRQTADNAMKIKAADARAAEALATATSSKNSATQSAELTR